MTLQRKTDVALLVITALVCQAAFWYYSMPGPQIRQPGDLPSAMRCCLVSVILLFLLPWIVAIRWLGVTSQELGLGMGNTRFGWAAVAFAAPIMVIGTLAGSSDPQIQEFYPIPGDAISESLSTCFLWFASYLCFYISFEFFYRGFLLRVAMNPQNVRSVALMIGIQAFCCFLIHIGKPNAELIASLPASVAFGWIAWRSRSIWYGVLIHFAVGVANDLGAM